ncbi:MAG: acyl-CoA dehydrogenase family protein [Pirellulaceae bacterium]|nr:acyl-CoA dehydrogenase family protein [Pirellulaceae bacterium]
MTENGMATIIRDPADKALEQLCQQLAGCSDSLLGAGPDGMPPWPRTQLELCGRYGVYEWFLDPAVGGQGWNDVDLVKGYLELSAACLATTFIITQRTGACRRIAGSGNEFACRQLLPGLVTGETFSTVGLSHLTTSHRHLGRPVLRAEQTSGGFLLDGFSPWVTGATMADSIVVGATLEDGDQVLIVVPTDHENVEVHPPVQLMALSSSHTGRVDFHGVEVSRDWLLAGPAENVMSRAIGANPGGLQTSTLAVGLADAALHFLEEEAKKRPDLEEATRTMRGQWQQLHDDLLAGVAGDSSRTKEQIRSRANHMALNSSQAALAAAKGAGYVSGHDAGRWCREAMFFLVWSCPQPVMNAHLCQLAGLID